MSDNRIDSAIADIRSVRYQPSDRLVWLLAAMSVVTFEIAAFDEDRPSLLPITVCIEAIGLILLACTIRSSSRSQGFVPVSSSAIFCLISGCYVLEILVRFWTRSVPTLEFLLLAYFRNTVLVLAAFSVDDACRRLCATMSLFLIIFSSALTHQQWVQYVVVLYATTGAWWLMTSYWENLRCEVIGVARSRKSPWRWLTALSVLLILLALVPKAGVQARVSRGFLPSSGGADWYSESARRGVGDGDSLVAGTENIQSFAAIEDAPFMSSHEPSLYDMFDDSYDEPVRPQNQDRAIGLPPQLASIIQEREVAESRQAGKQFSTVRKSPGLSSAVVVNRDSRALVHVKGRVPLHLKLESYDVFDGVNWVPEPLPARPQALKIETLAGRPWLRLPAGLDDLYSQPEIHALKIIGIDTNRVPTPNRLLGLHLDHVDRLDMFAWAQPDLVQMDRDKLPSLTVMQLQTRVMDPAKIRNRTFPFDFSKGDLYRQQTSETSATRIRDLAASITQGLPPGGSQIEAIVHHVRSCGEHRPELRPPENCSHTVEHFLFEQPSGPDYLFASSAVMLLRSLGYSARLVSGLYADPKHYEARTGHTSVFANDVHFWAEVRLGHDDWLSIEPTPGYELLRPVPGLVDHLLSICVSLVRLLRQQWMPFIGMFIAAITAWWLRVPLADAVATLLWWMQQSRPPRDRVRWTVWLLTRRCDWIGQPRPASVTSARWISNVTGPCSESGGSDRATEFLELVNWASYSPAAEPPPQISVHDQCVMAVRSWSRKSLQSLALLRDGPPASQRRMRRAVQIQRIPS